MRGGKTYAKEVRELAFVQNYIALGFRAQQAAIAAGFSPASAHVKASILLKRPSVQALLADEFDRINKRHDLSVDKMMDLLKPIAHGSMQHYMQIGSDGLPRFDFTQLNAEQWSAIAEVTVDELTEGRGENAREVKRIKVKLHDKQGAIDKILRVLGAYIGKEAPIFNDNRVQTINNVNVTVEQATDQYLKLVGGK